MSEDVCPVKLERRTRLPTKKINPYHDWQWERNGKDRHGAVLKRGICKLCGLALEVERFCARCGMILPKEEPSALCVDCIEKETTNDDVSKQILSASLH